MQTDDFNPVIGVAEPLASDLVRIVAPNPSPMTFRGTNTYLLGRTNLAVIDPGPNNSTHLDAILSAVRHNQRITHIFVTHSHLDHSPLARPLAQATQAPVLAFGPSHAGRSAAMDTLAQSGLTGGGEGIDHDFQPDVLLQDGQFIRDTDWKITAHWTPGHLSNHMCFATETALFCGDHVMGWASSLVSPPDGDLGAFMNSCARLRALPERPYYPGHGAPIQAPYARLDWLMAHRRTREATLVDALSDAGQTLSALTRIVYHDIDPAMLPAAERNLLAHLIDLHARGLVRADPTLGQHAHFSQN
ncbi:MAG: MBL fold metallo-hydrolase [Tateyamaria sp.]|uniref:MBL fold metallo-hydrolase n=1 Tax=Tateyamaria sp. TaxID=1929288 RepID=UPI00329D5068